MKPPTQWEYRVETLGTFWTGPKDQDIEGFLDQLGEEGWEVFSIENPPNSNKLRIVGKRPLAQAARRRRTWPGDRAPADLPGIVHNGQSPLLFWQVCSYNPHIDPTHSSCISGSHFRRQPHDDHTC